MSERGAADVVRMSDLTSDQRRLVLAMIEAGKAGEREDRTVVAEVATSAPAVVVETVTPRRAGEYLARNTRNRALRQGVVDRYAADMAAGMWDFNGEPIQIADDGTILNGQHRLAAIVKAQVALPLVVVTDLPPETQDTIDRNLRRGLADALRFRGEKDVNNLAAAIAQSFVLETPTPGDFSKAWPSMRQGLEYFERHRDVVESVRTVGPVRNNLVYPQSTAAALHHQFGHLDRDDADAFWTRMADGIGLDEVSPILRLREFMLKELVARRRAGRTYLCAITIKAWNSWRRGDPMQQLKWRTGGSKPEPFPTPE